jgi:hypothetical protein
MTRLVILTTFVLCTVATSVGAQDQYEPFNYDESFQRPAERPAEPEHESGLEYDELPEPAQTTEETQQSPPLTQPEPEPEPGESTLDLDDLREMLDRRLPPEDARRPGPSQPESQWGPLEEELPQKPQVTQQQQRQRQLPLVSKYTDHGRAQLMIMTGCSWNERDPRTGEFNSSCIHCNVGNTGALNFVNHFQGKYTVGPEENADIRIVDITTPAGGRIDMAMGDGQYSLTELCGKNDPAINQYSSATPVFVTRYPDRDPTFVVGWPPGLDPNSHESIWWFMSLFGAERDQPATWGVRDADMQAISLWARSGPTAVPTHLRGWGATVSARDLINMIAPGGRKQIYGDTYLVVPENFRPRLTSAGGRHRIEFSGNPYIEYRLGGFFPKTATLSHVEIAPDFSKLTLVASGYRTNFPITVSWDDSPYQASRAQKRNHAVAETKAGREWRPTQLAN